MPKIISITQYFIKHPSAKVADVAAKFNVSVGTAYVARRRAQHELSERMAAALPTSEPMLEEPLPAKADAVQIGGDHYKTLGIEPWRVVDTWPLEQQIGFHRGNALKYVMRAGTKDDAGQDIRKAAHYLTKLSEVLDRSR